jgi:autotransporter-associated beta strand protein
MRPHPRRLYPSPAISAWALSLLPYARAFNRVGKLTVLLSAVLSGLPVSAQTTHEERADILLDHLNSTSPNVGQTGGGPNRIGRTGFWYGQGRIARGNIATGLSYISAAVADADAEGANSGFSLWPGMDAWYRHNSIFSQELKDKYRDEYVGAHLYAGATPNQRLMGATACYLASEIWGAAAVTANSNASNSFGDPTGKAFIDHILTNLPRYNSEEHNAGQYLTFNLGPFHTLANFAPDPLLRQKARMGFDWMVADTAPSWLNGYACISNTRGRVAPAQEDYNGTTALGWWLKFGGPNPVAKLNLNLHVQYALPDFPGLPAEIIAAATDRSQSYTRRSVAQRYVSGAKNAYFKQTWMTPKYALWSQVEAEVSLNPDGSLKINTFDTRYIQDGYQGERWGIAWDDAPSGDSVITIKSPTTYRGSTGGISIYEDTLQHEETLIAVHNIPAPSGQTGNDGTYPNQYVKGALPNGYLAYTDESSSTGRIFLHYNNLLVSIYLTNPFNNFSGSPGFDVPATKLGVIVETAAPSEYPQSTPAARLAAFRSDILATTTDASGINDAAPRLTYTNRKGKTLSLTYGQPGSINGDPVDYLQWPTLGNPWMHQPPTGNLTLFGPDRRLHYNFNDWTITTNHRPTAIAASPVIAPGISPIDVDLTTRVADAETPSDKLRYQVTATGKGSVELLPDGHTARFTPAAPFAGHADFEFTATDSGIDPRLVLHYDFEQADPSKDASGNARPATISTIGTGSALAETSVPAALSDHSSKSLRLTNGSVGSAKISRQLYQANAQLSNGSWTFSTWFNRATYVDDDFLLSIGTGDGFGGDGDELQLYCEAQKQTLRLLHYSSTNAQDINLTASAVSTNTWRHAAIRFDRTSQNTGNITLFLNGRAVGTATNITWALKQDSPIIIGGPAKPTVLSRDFNGSIDDVALFRGTLTDAEIRELATSPVVHSGGLALSQSVTVQTLPPAVAGLSATPTPGGILLSWNDAGSVNYRLQRGTSAAGPFSSLASGLDTTSFTDESATPGVQYFYVLNASNHSGSGPLSPPVSATIPANDSSLWNSGLMTGWAHGARIAFPGYIHSETLTNFPVLVALDATQIPGFSYSQFAFSNGADLRFTDAAGTTELNYEMDTWNPTGTSYVWVQIPSLSSATTICAFWGNAAASTSATPDSIANLSLWLKADAITGLNDGDTVNTWNDSSTNARNATRNAGAPVYRTNALNGKPVVRFPADGESRFTFPQMSDIRTVFWVVKETATTNPHFLLGDDNNFHFHRGNGGPIWSSTNASANIRNGTTRLMGTTVNGTTTSLGSGYRLISVVTSGNVEASRLSRDRTQVGRSWDGDVAEIIIYNRALTNDEETRIGTYLAQKYNLTTTYPGVPPLYTTDGSTWSNGYLGVFHLRETSGQHFSSTSGNAATRSVSATNQGSANGIIGTADEFNGTSNFVSLPDYGSSPQVTVEAWVNLTSTPSAAGGGIVSSDAWASGYTHFKAASNRSFSASINSGGTVISPSAALPLGSWSHVAYTISGNAPNGLALYQNGALLGTDTGHANNNLGNLNIAREFNTRYLNARFDEVRISSVSRSAAWLQATYATIRESTSFANPSFASTYAANALAMVATRPASAITGSTATLHGNLAYTGGASTTVTLYWGPTDGGTTPANWANSIPLGTLPVGNFSANIISLTPGTTYYFRALASNINGNSWAPDSVALTTPTSAPGGLGFTSSNGDITLQWDAVPGASSYAVKRSNSPGGPYTTLFSHVTGTRFLDSLATAGSTWHYVVSSSNAAGESANSAELVIPTLKAPANLTSTPGDANVTLGWTAVPGATGYTVKRATNTGGPYTVQGTSAIPSYSNSAPNGTTYYYIVTASAAGFESPPSNESSSTPIASLATPTGLIALPANGSATLTWNPVANAQTYTLKRSTSPGGPYTNVATGLLSPAISNGGLTNGAPYYYVVAAVSGSITSANSAEVNVIPATTPTTFTTASSGSWNTATWTPSPPIAAFATTIVLNNGAPIASTQNLGSFLFNKLQLTGQGVTLTGDRLYLSGTSPAITCANNVAHLIANPVTIDAATTVTVLFNVLALTGNLEGAGSLLKTGSGTLSLGGLASYHGNTTLDGGTLRFTTDNSNLKSLIIGATPGSTAVGNIDLGSASATATDLILQNHSITPNTISIGAGESLMVQGDVLVGNYSSSSNSNTRLTVNGAGSFKVLSDSGQFSLGKSSGGSGVNTLVDLSGLQTFNLQYPSDGGFLSLGNNSGTAASANTLTLAVNNLIDVDAILLGNNQPSNATQTLRLGSGTNTLRVDSIAIGTTTSPSGGGRGIGSFLFNNSSGNLSIRDRSGTAGANLFIADNGGNGNGFGTFDVTGHHADIKLALLRMGASSNATARTDTFAFNQGSLDIVSLDVGLAQNSTFTRTSQINLGGGTITLGNGDSENPGLISLARNAAGVLNLTGGTVSAYTNITESNGTGSATLTLNGATLDLLGNSIVDLTTLNLQSGTLRNVAQINGGAAITKTGAGTLILDGSNTLTSPIAISAGTLNLASTHHLTGSISGAGNLTISGTLAGNGSVSAPTTVTGSLAPAAGALAFTGPLSFSNGRIKSNIASNSAASIGQITVAGNLTTAAPVDVLLDAPGSLVNLSTLFWESPQSWPLLSAANLTATFTLGTVSTDPAARVAAAYGNFSLQQSATTLTLVWTPLTAIEKWRYANFGISANTGNGADNADPDNDGVTNLAEFTAGTNPNDATSLPSHIWTSTTSGDWANGIHWNLGTSPASNSATKLEFLTGNTSLPAGPIIATSNHSGSFLLNTLRLAGTGTGTIAVNLAGGPLEFRNAGTTAPVIWLNAFPSAVTYTIANDITLANDTTFNASNSGRYLFTGTISGPGSLTRIDRWSTLVLAGNNSYQGTTTIPALGSIQIGNDSPTGTPGSGPIVNNGSLRIDRSGTLDLTNSISGSGSLTLDNPAAADTVVLSADNSFSGGATLNRGTLRLTHSNALGTGSKTLSSPGADRRIQLSNSITLPAALTLSASSNSFDGGGISNFEGENEIQGPIQITTGNGLLNISSTTGNLLISGPISASTTGRSLILGGASTGTISGAISNGLTTAMPVTKQGSGTWTLTNSHSYTGPTAINAGKLVLSGSLTSDLTATTTGILAPQGSAITSGGLNITQTGRLEVRPGDSLTVGGSVTLAGPLDLIAAPGLAPGTRITILSKSSPGAIDGAFLDKPEGSTFNSSGYNWRISYLGGDGNDVTLTIPNLTAVEVWRQTHFGTTANTGDAADSFDANHDGETNLLEFATGQSPHAATLVSVLLNQAPGSMLDVTYTRSRAAVDSGYQFSVEYDDQLRGVPWTSIGQGTVQSDDGTLQTVQALIPAGIDGKRFVRVSVSTPLN